MKRTFAAPGEGLCWMVQPVMLTSAVEPSGAVDEHIRRRRCLGRHVALDVAGADVQVPHATAARDHAAARVVADVAADDVRLVEIDVVVKHADAGVVIQVAVADDDVAIAHGEVDAMPSPHAPPHA
jgi:hypothetical protein